MRRKRRLQRLAQKRTLRCDRGFTLIEVLIALFICVLVGIAALHVASAAISIEQKAAKSDDNGERLNFLLAAKNGGWTNQTSGFILDRTQMTNENGDWNTTSLTSPEGEVLYTWSSPAHWTTNAAPAYPRPLN